MRFIIKIAMACVSISTTIVNAHNIKLPQNIDELSLVKISQRIYVVHGIHALPDENNIGFISNTGIILTEEGIVIIDSGGSFQVGQLIVSKVQALSDKPIVALFNTHVHGDHWLGNAAIRTAFPKVRIYAHKRAIERLRNGEDKNWSELFLRMTKGVAGSERVLPDHALNGGEILEFSDVTIKTHHTGHAHTDNDVMLEIPQEQLIFSGDIIEYGRAVSSDVPQDFNIKGQIDAIKYLLALPVDTFVPGHGETGGREVPEAALEFLKILYASVKRNYDAGFQDFEMREDVENELSEFSNWFGFDQVGRLISFVYQQVEEADFQ